MYILKKIFVILFISLFSIIACTGTENISDSTEVKQIRERRDEILEKVLSMSLDEKIGQLFIGGFEGVDNLSKNDISLIEDYKLSGLIFFRKNIQSSNQTISLINQIKNLVSENNGIPMFLSLDQEGGVVTRLPEDILRFISAREIGKINDPSYAYNIAKLMGEIIHSLGFNMNFAPVLDVYTNPENTVIGSRAFSSDKEIVAELGVATMKGFKDSNIISVGKHYPGHGDTSEDSHYELPVLDHDYDRIRDVELYPFKQAIDNGIDSLLVSHLLYKNIDKYNIATLSRTFLYDILRGELGFRGIVITDDMIMKGLTDTNSIEEASLKALKAGVDILLIGFGYENIINSISRVKQAVLDGEIEEFEIDRKVYNILRIKQKYGLNNDVIPEININEVNSKIRTLLNKN